MFTLPVMDTATTGAYDDVRPAPRALATEAVHAGRDDLARQGLHAPPIDLSTTYPSYDSRGEAEARRARLDALAGEPYTGDAPIFTGTAAQLADLLEELAGAGLTGFRLRPAVAGHDGQRELEALGHEPLAAARLGPDALGLVPQRPAVDGRRGGGQGQSLGGHALLAGIVAEPPRPRHGQDQDLGPQSGRRRGDELREPDATAQGRVGQALGSADQAWTAEPPTRTLAKGGEGRP